MFQVAMVRLIAGHYRPSEDDPAGDISTRRPSHADGWRQSSNIEDRRSEGGGFGGGGFGGGGFPIPMGGGGGGLFKGGFGLVAFVVIAMIMGADPGAILSDIAGGGGGTSSYTPAPPSSSASRTPGTQAPAGDAETQFVSRVLKSTEDVWQEIFRDMGRQYRDPKLVLFRDATRTECGVGQAAMGPFYCPADQRVYLDLGFFDELARRFRAPGQFPQAYVIAHEVGHHVQNLLGISGKVQQMRQSMSKRDGNALSVRTELQADCFAGVWANRADKQRGGPDDRRQGCGAGAGPPRRRSATTRCRSRARAASCPTASRTAPVHSGHAGSAGAWRRVIPASAIRSGRSSSNSFSFAKAVGGRQRFHKRESPHGAE